MGRISQNKYYVNDIINREWFDNNGFRYNVSMSEMNGQPTYYIRFPIVKYKYITTIECEIMILYESKEVIINVFRFGTRDIYPAWYYDPCCNLGKSVNEIDEVIESKLQELNIAAINDGE